MAGTTAKVLGGCALGCLVVVLLVVGMGWMGYHWARDMAATVDQAELVESELEEQFGGVRAFLPVAAPGPPADRLEVFVAVREALAEPRRELAAAVAGMAPEEGEGRVMTGLNAARAGLSMAPRAIELVHGRNQALLDRGMGLGEYTWLYWLTYNAWLGHPADDSELQDIIEAHQRDEGSVQIHMDDATEPERLRWRLRRDVTAMLVNLETELAADGGRAVLHDLVAAELERLEADPARVPWQDGLPDALAEGLEPFRDRLEATYSRAANPFELRGLD